MEKIKLAITDIDGVLRGKYINKNKLNKVIKNGCGFCSVIFGWDCNDQCYNNVDFTGWHTGYHDIITHIDLDTLRNDVFNKNDSLNITPLYLLDYSSENFICPRSLLKNIISKCKDMGFTSKCALEYEWFNFKNDEKKSCINLLPTTQGNFGYSLIRLNENESYVTQICDSMKTMNIPIESIHCESGPGVLEAAIEYCEALEMADRSVLFKYGVKNIAKQFNYIATFMAKINTELPGSGGHLHQSLWKDGKNVFQNQSDDMSETMKQYLAGQLYCLPHILPMFAPNINSYKRLVDGYWAPTRLGWCYENRTTTHRVIPANSATRIECRVAGADANPYLVIAAALASGLYGIKNQLDLNTMFPCAHGNAYKNDKLDVLPNNLYEATYKMKHSNIAVELFGETFVKHFVKTRLWELKKFNESVTDWELKRYIEII